MVAKGQTISGPMRGSIPLRATPGVGLYPSDGWGASPRKNVPLKGNMWKQATSRTVAEWTSGCTSEAGSLKHNMERSSGIGPVEARRRRATFRNEKMSGA
jgi:hypothetical protein